MKKLITIFGLVSVAFLSGCSVVPYATPEQKSEAIGAAVPEGKSAVYVFRGEDDFYKGYIHSATFNGNEKWFYAKTFTKLVLEPGKVDVELKSPALIGGNAELSFNVNNGETKYLEFSSHYRPLVGPGMEIKVLDNASAKQMMKDLKFIVNNNPK